MCGSTVGPGQQARARGALPAVSSCGSGSGGGGSRSLASCGVNRKRHHVKTVACPREGLRRTGSGTGEPPLSCSRAGPPSSPAKGPLRPQCCPLTQHPGRRSASREPASRMHLLLAERQVPRPFVTGTRSSGRERRWPRSVYRCIGWKQGSGMGRNSSCLISTNFGLGHSEQNVGWPLSALSSIRDVS